MIFYAGYAEKLVDAEIVGKYTTLNKGENQIAVKLKIKQGWHIYWKNPGDSGLPTEFVWELPDNVSISEPYFPAPKKIPFSDMANYGYENEVLILFNLIIDDNYINDKIKLNVKINRLVCKEECIAEKSDEEKEFKIDNSEIKSDNFALFQKFSEQLPEKIELKAESQILNNSMLLKIYSLENIKNAEFFPYQSGIYMHGAEQNFKTTENGFSLILTLDKFRIDEPESLNGVLVTEKDKQKRYYEINVPLTKKE